MNDTAAVDQPTGVINLRPNVVIDERKARQALEKLVEEVQKHQGIALSEAQILIVDMFLENLPSEEANKYRIGLRLQTVLEQVLGPVGVAELKALVQYMQTNNNPSPPAGRKVLNPAKTQNKKRVRIASAGLSKRSKEVIWVILVMALLLVAWYFKG